MLKKISALIAALLLTSNSAKAQSAEFINILTGGTAGVYYPLGSALTKIYGDNIKGSKVQVQVTKASVENLNLLQEGKGEIAFVLGDSAKDAWAGNEDAGFKNKLDKLGVTTATLINYGKGHAIPQTETSLNTLYSFFKNHLSPPKLDK